MTERAIFTQEHAAAVIEAHLPGTTVRDIRRQSRWRPTWFATVERADGQERIVLRGDRPDSHAFPLSHEYTFHRIADELGMRVPHVYGYVETPGFIDAFLTSFAPGVPHFEGVADDVRDAVVDEYLQEMVRFHESDPGPFVEAGITVTDNSPEGVRREMERRVVRWRSTKDRPDPFTEFAIGWWRRHLPDACGRAVPCLRDTGQFHHENGHLVAILDLEFGQVGDPMLDLTVWRMRDTLLHFGDMAKWYARYEDLTGRPVDLEAIKRYHFASCLGNQLQFGEAIVRPTLDTDLMTFLQWTSETNLMATDFLGEYLGIELPDVEVPSPRTSREDAAFDHLVGHLGSVRIADEEAAHSMRLAFRTARMLQRRHQVGAVLDAADIDDVHGLLGGRRPTDWFEAERELERFVLADAADGRHDERLTVLFHRRNSRTHLALGAAGSTMTRHHQCQRFDGAPSRVVQF